MTYRRITDQDQYNLVTNDIVESVFQSWEWGEFKKQHGWRPVRYKAIDESTGADLFSFQILERRVFKFFYVLWIPGYSFKLKKDLSMLLSILNKNYKFYYLRMSMLQPISHYDTFSVSKFLTRPYAYLTSGCTVHLDLKKENDEWLKSVTKKHRYYIRRSNKSNILWHFGQDDKLIDDFSVLLSEVEKKKNVGPLGYSKTSYYELKRLFKENQRILIGYIDERPVSGCITIIHRNTAFYMSAATNKEGRSISAAYSMIYELRLQLKNYKIEKFDFGGVDLNNSSANGVNHFKKGFGGDIVYSLGEWQNKGWLLRFFGNLIVFFSKRSSVI